jgi:glycosyltransferase involved in cell wall biosynthesis
LTIEKRHKPPEASPLISVVIPTYNRLELLKQTVDSVRNQTFTHFEIIVVDDGSSDGTSEWLDQQEDLIVIHQANSGIATSRNNGIARSRGKWVAFVDHDDLWDPGKLQVQADFILERPDHALVAVRHVRLGSAYRSPKRPRWIKGDLLVEVYSKSFIHTSSVVIRKDALEEIGGFPSRYRFADEFHVWLELAAHHPIAFYDQPMVFIRFYESNTSHNRIGVRTDTYDILMNHYDPARIPRSVFLRTMSDHDISYGRAYLSAGDSQNALKWFRNSLKRTPWRPRSMRYFLKYNLLNKLGFKGPKSP